MNISLDLLRKGDRRTLAKAITLIESTNPIHQNQAKELLEEILPNVQHARRIGITGVPGVGKSTFIESFGLNLISQGKKVAVLAVDPSSPISGGSIMGDKTRMENLSRESNAFIRPSPTAGSLGGVAQKTRETILLCEAAGFDTILIETVGVGQSEYDVASMVDFFMMLLIPNSGDELQGIKKGIVELADGIIINKADGELVPFALQTQSQYESALQIIHRDTHWSPRVLTCSAIDKVGFEDISKMIDQYFSEQNAPLLKAKRDRQKIEWMQKLFFQIFESKINKSPSLQGHKKRLTTLVQENNKTALQAAEELYLQFMKESNL